ncbi:hypothetical protein HID58_016695, partial [Brassica napus]
SKGTKPDTTLKQKPKRTNWATVQYKPWTASPKGNPLKKKSDSPHHLQSSPGASKETRRNTIDGEDELETNRSTRTVKAKARAAKSDVADLRIDEEFNRLQSIFKPPTYLHGTTDIFIDLSKLEDATTQTIGDEESSEEPAKAMLRKPSPPETKAGEDGAMEATASQKQSRTFIGRADATPEFKTGRKHRNRYTKTHQLSLP